MNNDYLRVNSKTEDSDVAVSEFKNEEQGNSAEQSSKLNLITLLNFSRTKSGNLNINSERIPKFKGLIAILLIQAALACLLTFAASLASDVTILIFASVVASMMIPLFLILFFYNLNVTKTTNLTEIITGVIIGISSFIFLNFISPYIYQLVSRDWLKSLFIVTFRDLSLFLIANLFIKIAKKDNLFDAILLTVSMYAGYTFISTLSSLSKSLFVSVEIFNGETSTITSAILQDENSFKSVIITFIDSLLKDSIFMALVMSCFAIINGGVIGLNVSPLKDENYKEWSLYVLFVVTVVLHLGAVFPSTVKLFNFILKSLSIVFSSILAVMIINYYLSKIHVD